MVDAAAGVVAHPARTTTILGAFSLRGLKIGEERLDVHVAADGTVEVDLEPGSRLARVVTNTSEVAVEE